MFKLSDQDRRLIGILLTPSWLSGLLVIVAGLVVCVGVIAAFEAHNSPIQQQLVAWQQNKPQPALTTPEQVLPENDKPSLRGSWPLLVVWSLIGLVVYAIATTIVGSIARAEQLRESLDDVHARPRDLLESTAEHILLRVVALIILLVLVQIFVKQLLPYSITAAHASAADVLSPSGALYALLSFAMVTISLHVQVIFLRLTVGRVRLFSTF